MKKTITYLILAISILTLTACAGNAAASVGVDSADVATANPETASVTSELEVVAVSSIETTPEVEYDPEDLNTSLPDAEGATFIQLNGDSITVEGPGTVADGSNVTITAAGTYQISGTLDAVSYTHLTLPTMRLRCRSRWSPDH